MSKRKLKSINDLLNENRAAGQPMGYFSDNRDWLIVISQYRDIDNLGKSNFRSALKELGGEGDAVKVERFNHWGCVWVEFIIIDPNAEDKIKIANEMLEVLDEYSILNDEDYYELEQETDNEHKDEKEE